MAPSRLVHPASSPRTKVRPTLRPRTVTHAARAAPMVPVGSAVAAAAPGRSRTGAGALLATRRWDESAAANLVVRAGDALREADEGRIRGNTDARQQEEQKDDQRDVDDDEERHDAPGHDDRPEDPLVEGEQLRVAAVSAHRGVVDTDRSE